jgi:hypothetical protein
VEKERFLHLAINYTALTVEESEELDSLQKRFPYSQIIHNLATKGAQDNQLKSATQLLHLSAVYTADRTVLKELITSARSERAEQPLLVVTPEATVITPTEVVVTKEKVVTGQEQIGNVDAAPVAASESAVEARPALEPSSLSGEELNNELMHDLDRLQQLKHDFEETVTAFNNYTPSPALVPSGKRAGTTPAETTKKTSPIGQKKKPATELIIEPPTEGLLEDIKSTRKQIQPENPRQKEQLEIIDQFIKKQPSITRANQAPDNGDLSDQNASLTDNIVSETLVDILLRQGKKDKAIEVLRKLIWKFPQKKSIFAAQIEVLKK